MKRNLRAALASLTMTGGLMAGALSLGAPAQADPLTDSFLSTLNSGGVTGIDPATAASVGQSVCPMLVEPGQNAANVAAPVSEAIGRPLGPATMFTGLAISAFCPGAVASLANGQTPFPLPSMFGI